MTPEYVVSLASEAVKLSLILALPLLGTGLVVGLIVAVLQATTQVQEMTLSFVPKIVVVLLALLAAMPWMLQKISYFTSQLILSIPQIMRKPRRRCRSPLNPLIRCRPFSGSSYASAF